MFRGSVTSLSFGFVFIAAMEPQSNWSRFRQSFKNAVGFRPKTELGKRDAENPRASSEERTPLRTQNRNAGVTDRKRHESDPASHSGDANRIATDIDNNEKQVGRNFRLPLAHPQSV